MSKSKSLIDATQFLQDSPAEERVNNEMFGRLLDALQSTAPVDPKIKEKSLFYQELFKKLKPMLVGVENLKDMKSMISMYNDLVEGEMKLLLHPYGNPTFPKFSEGSSTTSNKSINFNNYNAVPLAEVGDVDEVEDDMLLDYVDEGD